MKKFLLSLFTLVFAVSFAVAQNTSTVDVNGNGNDNKVSQDAKKGVGNTATIKQGDVPGNTKASPATANFGKVRITQIGKSNEAFTGQNGNNNFATQEQDGNNNYAKIGVQRDFNTGAPEASPKKYPNGNQHTQIQHGDENKATADVFNGANFGKQEQYGDRNVSNLQQSNGDYNKAYTYQKGDDNFARISQLMSDGEAKPDENVADIYQKGDLNEALIDQNGGPNNTAEIDQDGNGNNVGTKKSDYGIVQTGMDNDSKVSQKGNDNDAIVQQIGDGNRSRITQDGDNNKARQRMTNGNHNNIVMSQDGKGNLAVTETWGDDNDVNINQKGDKNDVYLNMRGTGGTLNVVPGGGSVNNNNIDVDQLGDNNLLSGGLENGSMGNTVKTMQKGDNNTIGSGTYSTDGIIINGMDNKMNIMQNGNDHSSLNTIIGNNNSVVVDQTK